MALTSNTWLTGTLAKSRLDLPRRQTLETLYGDLGLDHWFDPVGVRLGVANLVSVRNALPDRHVHGHGDESFGL